MTTTTPALSVPSGSTTQVRIITGPVESVAGMSIHLPWRGDWSATLPGPLSELGGMSSRLAISCCAARSRAADAVNAASSLGLGVPAASACGAAAGAMFASSASVLCQACSVTSKWTTRCCVRVSIAVSISPSLQLNEMATLSPFEPGWLAK